MLRSVNVHMTAEFSGPDFATTSSQWASDRATRRGIFTSRNSSSAEVISKRDMGIYGKCGHAVLANC
jgi:hypothetical protein